MTKFKKIVAITFASTLVSTAAVIGFGATAATASSVSAPNPAVASIAKDGGGWKLGLVYGPNKSFLARGLLSCKFVEVTPCDVPE